MSGLLRWAKRLVTRCRTKEGAMPTHPPCVDVIAN